MEKLNHFFKRFSNWCWQFSQNGTESLTFFGAYRTTKARLQIEDI